MKRLKNIFALFIFAIFLIFTSCNNTSQDDKLIVSTLSNEEASLKEDQFYYSKEDVSKYLHEYNKLPENYITKDDAYNEGWNPKKGNLWEVLDGYVIGGDRFYNREEKLPKDKYYEADVDYNGGRRNSKRLIFNYKGDIYYTDDHYENFERIYP